MPLIADPISVTAMMPMITPSAVRIERILCARIWLNAIRKLSVSSMVMSRMCVSGGGEWGVGGGSKALGFCSDSPPPTPHTLRLDLFDRDLGAIFQLPADHGVAPVDDFVARFDAVLDLDARGISDARLDL